MTVTSDSILPNIPSTTPDPRALYRDARNFLDLAADEIAAELERPLRDHVREYRVHLAGKGSTARHVRDAIRRVRVMLGLCRCSRPREGTGRVQYFHQITATGMNLAKSRLTTPRPRRSTIGPATVNHYIGSIRSFGAWMVSFYRAHRSPFLALRKVCTSIDIRRKRRPLSEEEAQHLIQTTAAKGKTIAGIPAIERSLMYAIACATGLRAGELQSLSRDSFQWVRWDGVLTRWVIVRAQNAKSKKERRVPLRVDIAEAVGSYLDTVGRDTRLFRRPSTQNGTRALQADLRDAGIPYCLDGAYADFHALRHTALSRLAEAGAPVTVVRDIAGHASVTTTDRYMHSGGDAKRLAVNALPAMRLENLNHPKLNNETPSPATVTAGLDRLLDVVSDVTPTLTPECERT